MTKSNPFASGVSEVEIPEAEPKPHNIKAPAELLGPGEYDISEDRYHADPATTPSLSASISKVLINESPMHARTAHPRLNPEYEPVEKAIYDMGSGFHKLVLGKGAEIEAIDVKDFRTDAAKAKRDAVRADGGIPMKLADYKNALAMAEAARWQMKGHDDLMFAMAGGAPERVIIWEEKTPAGPILCRSMIDWTPSRGTLVPDWKSTGVSAGPDGWGAHTMWDLGADIQEAFYLRGMKAVFGREFHAMLFAVVETSAPHALGVHAVMPEARAVANRKVQWAINVWGMCMHHNRWPGYGSQTFWQSPPPWHENKWISREDNGSVDLEALDAEIERLKAMRDIAPQMEGAEVTAANPFGFSDAKED